jgi:transcription elongation factor Elf1
MEDLKPCPMCGKEAKLTRASIEGWFVYCANCNLSMGCNIVSHGEDELGDYAHKEDAIAAWNKRA